MALDLDQLNDLQSEGDRLQKKDNPGNQDYLKNFVKMPDGVGWVDVRVLPPDKTKPIMAGGLCQPTRLVKLGVNGVNPRSYHSRRVLKGGYWVAPEGEEDCPANLHYTHLWKEADQLDKEGRHPEAEAKKNDARKLKPIARFYYNVVVVGRSDNDAVDNDNKILSVGVTVHETIINSFTGNEDKGIPKMGDVTDLDEGRTLRIYKDQKGQFPDYSKTLFLDPSSIGSPEDRAKWAENLHDIAALRRVLPFEELKEKLQIHLGIIKPTGASTSSYNPKDFQIKTETKVEMEVVKVDAPVDTPAASVETKSEVKEEVAASTATEVKPDGGETLIEDDFWNDIQGM